MSRNKTGNSNQFEEYAQKAIDRIEDILNELNIEYTIRSSERVNILCPVHGSEDLSSSCIYLSNGNYKCWSRGCDENIGANFIHLIRWALSQNKEYFVEWEQVFQFIDGEKFAVVKREVKERSREIEFMDEVKYPSISIPCPYYIDRGFSPETLIKFGIGQTQQLPYTGRSVVPVKYIDGQLMGFSGRSTYPKCEKCSFYHSKYQTCISKNYEFAHMFNKWFHSSGMKKSLTMYNIERINNTEKLAIVEGPSCVWRLDSFSIPACATLGKTFSQEQANLLKSLGITSILFLSDQDDAGLEFRKKFISKWHAVFKIYVIDLPQKDITEMSDEQVQNTILPIWNNI